ncbi:putative polysaccharide biosynthesis protein [Sporosarcina trichiuri]|uniref:putative polysaccharide biosynthesis protein n=1 Tax=Sporosarcina trichiuri TaxID=3056445 RepID=UPI0025B46EC0|nr:polysaccharide biosynthesis protein [Sporosarcina sp. 0.2-SM1T-5]WJY27928.1 polysaccharide biosynthesis protein [Sporosarcina sp. 0.2-SM1T-5]
MGSNLLKGTAILTIGLFLSKALGLIYVIPFYSIVGDKNIALYQYAYIPYNIALSIAISGAPLAISKFVSKYNALGDYATGRKLLKSSVGIMAVTGVLSFLALYFMAEPIAHLVIKDDEQVFTIQDITSVIRWVSYALLAVPIMSVMRGFLQGYQKFEPTSVSQLVEQIVRIAVVLIGAYLVVDVFGGSPKTAVKFAVFAAFVGAIASLGVLGLYWRKYSPEMNRLLENSPPAGELPVSAIYKEIIKYILPFVLVGVINPLYQFVDMITFNGTMSSIGLASVTDTYLTMLNFLTHKVVMIPVMVATGFSMAIIPVITDYYSKGDQKGITRSLDQTYQIMLFVTIPMVVGLMALSGETYQFLYSKSSMGASVLEHYAPAAILFGMYTVTAAIMQGIDRHKWIVFTSLLGLLFKMILNIPLIRLFEVNGAIAATIIGYTIAVGVNLYVIRREMNYKSHIVIRRIILILAFNAVMLAAVLLVRTGLYAIHVPSGKLQALLYVLICSGVGAAVYGFLSLRSGLAQKLLGSRITRITNKLKMGRS